MHPATHAKHQHSHDLANNFHNKHYDGNVHDNIACDNTNNDSTCANTDNDSTRNDDDNDRDCSCIEHCDYSSCINFDVNGDVGVIDDFAYSADDENNSRILISVFVYIIMAQPIVLVLHIDRTVRSDAECEIDHDSGDIFKRRVVSACLEDGDVC